MAFDDRDGCRRLRQAALQVDELKLCGLQLLLLFEDRRAAVPTILEQRVAHSEVLLDEVDHGLLGTDIGLVLVNLRLLGRLFGRKVGERGGKTGQFAPERLRLAVLHDDRQVLRPRHRRVSLDDVRLESLDLDLVADDLGAGVVETVARDIARRDRRCRIELDQHVSGLHLVAITGPDRDHLSRVDRLDHLCPA